MIDAPGLQLRPIPAQVAQELLAGLIPPGWTFAPGYPSEFSLETMQLVVEQGRPGPGGPFFIVRTDDDAVVGEIGARLDPVSATGQVGYSVVEPSWGQGFATEALRALLATLLGEADVRRVVAETMVDHLASRRVMEKAGMTYQGCRTAVVDGEVRDVVTYAIGSEQAAGTPSA